MNNSTVSIIVPVYKVEKYLPKCIDSILAQTFSDFELLLVDDGSPDNSGKICDEYAKRDSRIRVFHKPNGGVSSARNLGLDEARGEWVTFVDADDWLDSNCMAKCSEQFEKSDIIRFGMALIGKTPDEITVKHVKSACNKDEYLEALVSRDAILGVCGGIYRLSLFQGNQIRFCHEYTNGEDWLVQCQLIIKSQSLLFIDQPLYCYNRANDASCTASFKYKHHLSAIRVIGEISRITSSHMPEKAHRTAVSKAKCMLAYDFLASKIVTKNRLNHTEMQEYFNVSALSTEVINIGAHSFKEALLLRIYNSFLGRVFFYC